ncbi:hypothetical protein GV828_02060 [Flavobacterium sp. NST-5]|uniref:Aerotolerance regulator N-terminal domain-containing protein n=1 Tax=Flavobacterium ichthyis TaxID=2698827 RepID=A0ABW9Z819_9FLAO|nr:BatA domain-containing protein [Flavobacterium ichthyis]NBL63979.1 hypothetical protein [Flavobacterium ichthyis]
MQFKHPEILYFLFLLIIPILVHLFQLRRFKKEYFTNVHFLKELAIQTRKSSKLKKYLLLSMRLLLLAALIFAFAQPYFLAKDSKMASNEMFVVLDNSFSMQAKGKKGEILKRCVQELLEQTPDNQQFSVISNSSQFWETDIKSIQKELQQLDYDASEFSLETIVSQIKTKNPNSKKDLIVITDGIGLESEQLKSIDSTFNTYFIVPKIEQQKNVSIDSVYINQTLDKFYEISITISSSNNYESSVPVALYNSGKLIAKTVVEKVSEKPVLFTIPKENFNGYVSINDNALYYDNQYYFSISAPEKTNVLSIGDDAKNNFLRKIYSGEEFVYKNLEINSLEYNLIDKQDAIVLNELNEIPQALATNLKVFVEKGGNLIVIPSTQIKAENYNRFLSQFGKIQLQTGSNQEKQVSKISYNHPLYSTVFEKKTDNFQYPTVKVSTTLSSNIPAVLSFTDSQPFLISAKKSVGSVYVFAAAINKEFSNFQNSPLIVPTFYNMAKNSQKTGINALKIGQNQPYIANASLQKDEILKLKNLTDKNAPEIVPMQQLLSNKVKLQFENAPEKAGIFGLFNGEIMVQAVGFNYARTEGNLTEVDLKLLENFNVVDGIGQVFDEIQTNRTDNNLWKWFVILALLFLISEIFIQKFIK